jgi:hypothetical protein
MYEGRRALLRLQCKAEGDRVIFGHVGPHHEDAVRIGQIPLRERRCSPSVARAQTWDGGTVSDACLVLDPNHAETGAEQFLDEVIFLIVEGSAPERADPPACD